MRGRRALSVCGYERHWEAEGTCLSKSNLPPNRKTKAIRAGVKLGVALSKGKNATRDLGNAPSNVCTPTFLANEAKKLARLIHH